MAGAPAGLPAGIRLSDHISLGVIARTFPLDAGAAGPGRDRQGERARARPAGARDGLLRHRAGALHERPARARCCAACWRGCAGSGVPRRSRWRARAASRRRARRLGEAPLRRLYEEVVRPIATPRHQGGVVPRLAAGQPGRLLPGRGRHRGERRRVRACRAPAAARAPSRSCASWRWSRTARTCCSALAWAAMREGETTLAHDALAGAAAGHAVPGRPAVLRPCALAGGRRPPARTCSGG